MSVLLVAMCLCVPLKANAAQKTVRVGCVDIENFLKIDEDGNANGYGAEYLREIQKHTGWNYEYVRASWTECLDMLNKGELDLLLPAEYSEARASEFLFSEVECCVDYTALLGRKSDDSYYYKDYGAFNGMSVGMIYDNYLNATFKKYAGENGFTFESVYYRTGTELSAALKSGEVDAIVNGNMEYSSDQKLLAKIDYMPAYFITGLHNEALMSELNTALRQIILYNPYYTASLYAKYYESVERQAIGYTRKESDYIKQAGELTVVIEKNNYPMEWYDETTRTCRGVYVDILKRVEKESGLRFRFVASENPVQTINDGNADIWGGAYMESADDSVRSFTYTSFYYNCNYSLVGKKDGKLSLEDALTIAVLEEDAGVSGIIKKHHPNWKIDSYDNIKNCLKSVESGQSSLAAISAWGLSVGSDALGSKLIVIDGNAMQLPVCMGVPQNSNPLLALVLDKSILKIGASDMENCVFNSLLFIQGKATMASLIKRYPIYAVLIVAGILALMFLAAFFLYRNRASKKQNRILQEKNMELLRAADMQERLRTEAQTDALTGLKNRSNVELSCRKLLEQLAEQRHALLILDIDDFKKINDTRGHLAGDDSLRAMGRVLMAAAGPCDVAARIGGDEFLLFMADVESRQSAVKRVEEIFEMLKNIPETVLSCSAGLVLSETPHLSYAELFSDADRALYEAKKQGKKRYVVITPDGEKTEKT